MLIWFLSLYEPISEKINKLPSRKILLVYKPPIVDKEIPDSKMFPWWHIWSIGFRIEALVNSFSPSPPSCPYYPTSYPCISQLPHPLFFLSGPMPTVLTGFTSDPYLTSLPYPDTFLHYSRVQLSCFPPISKVKVCIRAKWLIRAGAYPGFCNMKRLGLFQPPPPLDKTASPSQGYPQQ